ncbi:hypothetical protein EDD85DRAFT_783065 [Armillaria nabsnona]|nr:hypothetical protein EDD85DRAFT_783065 [Armillaria nabsnona]
MCKDYQHKEILLRELVAEFKEFKPGMRQMFVEDSGAFCRSCVQPSAPGRNTGLSQVIMLGYRAFYTILRIPVLKEYYTCFCLSIFSLRNLSVPCGLYIDHWFDLNTSNSRSGEAWYQEIPSAYLPGVYSMLRLLLLISNTREIHLIAGVGNVAKKVAREIKASNNKVQTLDDDRDIINTLGQFTVLANHAHQ